MIPRGWAAILRQREITNVLLTAQLALSRQAGTFTAAARRLTRPRRRCACALCVERRCARRERAGS